MTRDQRLHPSALLAALWRMRPTITTQDGVGLGVLRLTFDVLPPGRLTVDGVHHGSLHALAIMNAVAPVEMHAARFVPRVLLPGYDQWIAAIAASRWRQWCAETLDAYSAPTSTRQCVVRGMARLHCYPRVAGESAAVRRAQRKIDAYFRRRGRDGSNLTPDDVLSELYALGRGELGAKRILRRAADGAYVLDPEAIRDVLRKRRFEAQQAEGDVEELSSDDEDPVEAAVAADLREQLSERSDPISQRLLDLSDHSSAEAATVLGVTERTVRNRRHGIAAAYRELAHPAD